jgi:hypothetical protein
MKRLNLDMISHSLFLCGMSAYRATILEIAEQVNELQEAVEELQDVRSQGTGVRGQESEVVAELGNGWRIERQPSATPAATTTVGVPGDSWLTEPDWVTDFASATDGT